MNALESPLLACHTRGKLEHQVPGGHGTWYGSVEWNRRKEKEELAFVIRRNVGGYEVQRMRSKIFRRKSLQQKLVWKEKLFWESQRCPRRKK